MLPPVSAIAVAPVATEAVISDGSAQTHLSGALITRQANVLAAQKLLNALETGSVASGKLAELLGASSLKAGDTLAKLAMNFAATIKMQPLPGESAGHFAGRLSDLIMTMKPFERFTAENKSGFRKLGITAWEFSDALKNPASPAAARIVALVETPVRNAREQAAKIAIQNYRDNAEGVRGAQVGLTQAGVAPSAKATGNATLLPAGQAAAKLPSAAATQTAPGTTAEVEGGKTASTPGSLLASAGTQPLKAAAQAAPASSAAASGQLTGGAAKTASASNSTSAIGQKGLQSAEAETVGIRSALHNVAEKAVDTLKSMVSPETRNEFTKLLQGETGRQLLASLPPLSADLDMVTTSHGDALKKAQAAARVISVHGVPIFFPMPDDEVENKDLQKLISRALSMAAATSRATAATRAEQRAVTLPQPDGVPFAQVPYPLQDAEVRKGRGSGDDEAGEDEQAQGEGEETLQGGSENEEEAPRRDFLDEAYDEALLDDEDELPRHASDAERAFHMYKKAGGF